MARYQVILAYDGTNYQGSQRQADAPTVQLTVEMALKKLNWEGKSVLFAGRTDSGVHASGQVMAFDLEWNHSSDDLKNALNALLPDDVAAAQVNVTVPEFHPRYDALARSYRYRIYAQPSRDPLRDRYYWRVWPAPDLGLLKKVASVFIGIHDFASFGGPTSPGGSTIREIMKANWQQLGDEFFFDVTANAYLYHMVRRLVIAQIFVGQEKISMADIRQYLHSPQGSVVQGLAPPQGLSLVKVRYPRQIVEEITE